MRSHWDKQQTWCSRLRSMDGAKVGGEREFVLSARALGAGPSGKPPSQLSSAYTATARCTSPRLSSPRAALTRPRPRFDSLQSLIVTQHASSPSSQVCHLSVRPCLPRSRPIHSHGPARCALVTGLLSARRASGVNPEAARASARRAGCGSGARACGREAEGASRPGSDQGHRRRVMASREGACCEGSEGTDDEVAVDAAQLGEGPRTRAGCEMRPLRC